MSNIIAKDPAHLRHLIEQEINQNGLECDLNHIDVSHIDSMAFLFHLSKFNGDISKWDVSNVRDMSCIFAKSQFNGDISNWNISNVKTVNSAFLKQNLPEIFQNGIQATLQTCLAYFQNQNSMGISHYGMFPMWKTWKECSVILLSIKTLVNGMFLK